MPHLPRRSLLALPLALAGLAAAGAATRTLAQDEPIFGRELMTEQERLAYRDRMRAARSEQERERIRAEHHALMRQRAQERGLDLPEELPPIGMGTGRRMGPGGGMGPGPRMGGGGPGN
jgi:hypothetical protein